MMKSALGLCRSGAIWVSAWTGLCWLSGGTSHAFTVKGREIPVFATAGEGALVSYLLVDFGGAVPSGDSYLLAYHYDTTGTAKTGLDLIHELSAATDLNAELLNFGFGEYVATLEVEGVITDTPDFLTDGRFWEYWTASYDNSQGGTVTWSSSPIGIGDRILTDGSIDGWYASAGGVRPTFPGADLNGDGRVDGVDAGILYRDWGHGGSVANLNDDATVDGADLAAMFRFWTGDASGDTASLPEPMTSPGWLGVFLAMARRQHLGRKHFG